MNSSELKKVIESVGRDRGIKKEIIISALEQAILAAAQKKYGANAVLEAHFNEETNDIDLFLFKKVVDSDDAMLEESEEIKIEDAHKLDPDAQIDDEIGVKVEAPTFGRVDAQMAKQVIFQKVRDAERDIIYGEYKERKGEIISGIARRIERGNLVIDLGKTDAFLPRSEIIPGEQFRPGDRVQAYLVDVVLSTRGPQLYLSRTSPQYLIKLFENEVPEIGEGIVKVITAAREPSHRSKIAVTSSDRDVDPVGACVGMKGSRVQNVINELRGEKIDIVPWSESEVVFVQNALSPAEILSINIDENTKSMEVIVDDSQLSLAIGKKGQNVRLAAQLTGWRLDIVSKTKQQERVQESVFNIQHIEGVSETLAHAIFQAGFANVKQVSEASIEELQKVPGYENEDTAKKLKENSLAVIEKAGDLLSGTKDEKSEKAKEFTAKPGAGAEPSTAKESAEKRLKEMLEENKSK